MLITFKSAFSALLLTFVLAVPVYGSDTVRPFKAEDIFELEHARDIQISPDGQRIVYVRHSNDIMSDSARQSLWLMNTANGQHYPLYADQHRYSQPVWSPDGSRIAFVSNRGGSNQINVHWLEQDTAATVSNVRNAPRNLSWSPDGSKLAFTMDVKASKTDFAGSVQRPQRPEGASWSEAPVVVERAYYQTDGRGLLESAFGQIFVLPAEGGTARQLTDGDYNHSGALAWTPQGDAVIFSANRSAHWEHQSRQSHLYKVDLQEGEPVQLTDNRGDHFNPVFSPDGRQLAYLYSAPEHDPYHNTKLRIMDWQSGVSTELLSDFDRSLQSPYWVGNEALVVLYQDRGASKLARVTLNSRILDLADDVSGLPSGRPYNSGMFSMNNAGDIAYTRGSAYRPGEVGYLPVNGQPQTLSALNEALLKQRDLGEVHEFTYESEVDGVEIHAWYITPPGFDPNQQYPLILEIHGGPHLNYGPHFSAELQRYAAEGYVVMYNNYRGSTSYGKDFAMLLDNKYASVDDFSDHNSGVDAMIEKGFIDDNNLFIAGGSAGGIGTLYAIGLTDRFNAAAATNPVVNWVSKVLTADSYLRQIQNQFPGMPWEEHEHYWQRSPLSLVGNVTTPTLLYTGELDRRTPISDTEQYYQALQLRQVDTAMVRVPGAYHGVSNTPSRMIAKTEHALAWFDRYRKNAE